MEELETPATDSNGQTTTTNDDLKNPSNGKTITFSNEPTMFSDDIDSSCSTPYVSAPSSPGRGPPLCGFYYSAPTSPMHFILPTSTEATTSSMGSSFEFEFSARLTANGKESVGSMSSAEELFFNGQIRPMKLSTHLQRSQILAPLLDLEETNCDDDNGDNQVRGRDLKLQNRSMRRRTRSMSPLRTFSFQWREEEDYVDERKSTESSNITKQDVESKHNEAVLNESTPSVPDSSSRSSSVGRSSKKWVFLKEFLYRSKSEGRNNGHKFWSSLTFSPVKDKKLPPPPLAEVNRVKQSVKEAKKKPVNGNVGKRRVPPSAHELHYTAKRAQAEEMKKKTYLPYRQGLFGCLGFNSKSYGAMNGFARALNPVYSR